MKVSYLTTVDNPYNPHTQFMEWYFWDLRAGYNTCSLLDRVMFTSNALSPADQDEAREMAIDEIVRENISGVHRRLIINEND